MSSSAIKEVVIIGGGFSGMMTAVQVMRQSREPVRITLFNTTHPVGRGPAYASYSDLHILNVPAKGMSAFPDQPDHFTQWSATQPEGDQVDTEQLSYSFLPRNMFGRYLESVLAQALRELPSSSEFRLMSSEVTAVRKDRERWIVRTADGDLFVADHAVLATGNVIPATPAALGKDLLTDRRYFANPWSAESVERTDPSLPVVIMGAGLTMVDVVIGLRENNFTGKIISVSPKGFEILPHRHVPPYEAILDELKPPYRIDTLLDLFRNHIKKLRPLGISGVAVVDAVRSKTQEIWTKLPAEDKKRFITHLRHLWGLARHRLPFHVHEYMQRQIREGVLEVIAGKITAVKAEEEGLDILIRLRADQQLFRIRAGRLINCTGPQTDVTRFDSALYRSLLSDGIIHPDDVGMGLQCTENGAVLDSDGNVRNGLYAIGSLRKGDLWESTAVPELRVQAAVIAATICGG